MSRCIAPIRYCTSYLANIVLSLSSYASTFVQKEALSPVFRVILLWRIFSVMKSPLEVTMWSTILVIEHMY